MQTVDTRETRFRHPFTMIVGGSTSSGKSEWIIRFLHNRDTLCTSKFARVIYACGEYSSRIFDLQKDGIDVVQGVPEASMLSSPALPKPLLLIIDDLLAEIDESYLNRLFTRGSHHWDVSVIVVTQHLFEKKLRVPRNNAHYLVLLRNRPGELQVRNLGSQLFPKRVAAFLSVYRDATSKTYGYLVIDSHPASDERLRLRTDIYAPALTVIYHLS